ncbi:MAG: hypothetical protein CO098_05730 [Bacteroidetes bacterium CG_4_9_14_3_um_filter_41_19]|nr:MAG: hypothetical protein CO098_05730 [Bacteroidetes bacterium CG_4_9_14_3_um_filter_41_19]
MFPKGGSVLNYRRVIKKQTDKSGKTSGCIGQNKRFFFGKQADEFYKTTACFFEVGKGNFAKGVLTSKKSGFLI